MTPAPSQAPGQRADSLARDLWRTGTWRLMPLLLLYIIGLAIIAPNVPTLMTNFMASRRAGKPMVCEDYLPAKQPQACQNAYSDVVIWSSASSFVSNSLLTFIMSPIVGSWSDSVGRKPFLLVATAVGAAPAIVLVLNIRFGVSLFWYYPAQAMGGAVSAISISLAYVADLLMPAHRASAFGTILASFSLGILIGPAIGGMLDPLVASLAASGIGLLCVLYVLFFLPESLSPHAAAECRQRQATSDRSMSNWMGMRILLRTPLFKKLTLCVMISGIASEGVQDLVFQYLKLKLAFTIKDLTLIFEMYGLCGMLVQTIVLRYLLRAVGEVHVLKIGLAAASVQMVAMAFVATKWQAFLSITMGCLGGMSFPAISSIKANNVDVHEQGQIQGALYGARALAVGTGPVIFAAVFAAFSRKDSPLPFFPGAPFLLGAVLMAAAVCVCATIQADAGKGHLAAASDDSESACGGNDDDCDHMAGLSLATSGMASVENAGELMEPLLTRSVKDKTSRDGTVASPMLPDSSYSDL